MNRRQFINTAVAATGAQASAARSTRPNILFILSDDLGYGDLSCYGRPEYKTPVLDNMAREGMKFTDNYTSAPVCTPTRVGYITGRYPHRLPIGLEEPLEDDNMSVRIPEDHPTIASTGPSLSKRAICGKAASGSRRSFAGRGLCQQAKSPRKQPSRPIGRRRF